MSDITELARALNSFQSEVVKVHKSASNPFFKSKYAPLDQIMTATLPALTKHGLSIMQLPDCIGELPALTTIVMHISGQFRAATTPLVLAKSDPQGVGSAITYMRRYAYAAALGIVIDEDDDGNYASQSSAPKKQVAKALDKKQPKDNDLATPQQKQQLKNVMAGLDMSKDAMGLMVETVLNKERVETVGDYKAVLNALEEK